MVLQALLPTLTEFKTPRVPYYTRTPQATVSRGRQDLLPILAVVSDKMRWCMMSRAEFEQAWGFCGRVE